MGYIKEVIFSAVICGILAKAVPSPKSGTGKLVKLVSSLVFLSIIIAPLADGITAMGDMVNGIVGINKNETVVDMDYNGSMETVSRAICEAAANAASEYFGVSAEVFPMKLIIDKKDNGEYSIRNATVYPCGLGLSIDMSKLERYFSDLLNCPVEVVNNA